jgi:dihydrofolate reductase
MSTVVMHNVVSVDGYIADEADQVGPLFDWYFNGDTALTEGGEFKVSRASAEYVRPMWDSIGSMVIGRHLFDLTNGWEGTPPAGQHVVVVSHRPKPDGWHPEASYHFTGDVAQAAATAKKLAGELTVAVAAGDVGGQALALGLVDEVAMDVVPVVFGSGKRYFGPVDGQHLLEDPDVVIRGDRVLHLRYRVRRWRPAEGTRPPERASPGCVPSPGTALTDGAPRHTRPLTGHKPGHKGAKASPARQDHSVARVSGRSLSAARETDPCRARKTGRSRRVRPAWACGQADQGEPPGFSLGRRSGGTP